MRKLLIFFITTLFLLSGCSQKSEDFISKLEKETLMHSSVTYKVNRKSYYKNGIDTLVTPFEIWTVRDVDEEGKNGYVWVNDYYRPYNMIYDNGSFYLAIPPKKTTVVYNKFIGSFISDADWIDNFLRPDSLTSLISDTINKTTISELVYKDISCTQIEIDLPKTRKGVRRKITYIIDRDKLVPVWSKVETSQKKELHVEELYFSDFDFDKVDLKVLKEKQNNVLKDNPVGRNGANSEVSMMEKMLHVGDKAPFFDGKDYNTGEEIKLADYIGENIIIVDFWYTHCPPCVKAMPSLSELAAKYESKGLKILGLNSVDNQPRSLENLKTFLEKRKLSYDIVLTQPSVDKKYKIMGYPTMYVIGKDGKIAFVEVGFDQHKFEKLTEVVDSLTR